MAASDISLAQLRASRPELFEDDPCLIERSVKWSYDIRQELLRNQTTLRDRDPIFFWSYGPQGSGKSSSVSDYFDGLGVSPVELNIDNLTRRYAKDVLKDESIINTQEGYFTVRNKWPTFVRHQLIHDCAEQALDIVWETTGRGDNLWRDFCDPLVQKFRYKIVVVYVLVPFIQLKQRLESRIRLTKQIHADFDAVLNQCRAAACNTKTWFVNQPDDVGGFVYFNNTLGIGKQERIRSEMELKSFLLKNNFDSEVRAFIKWRGVSDDNIFTRRRGKLEYLGETPRRSLDHTIIQGAVAF